MGDDAVSATVRGAAPENALISGTPKPGGPVRRKHAATAARVGLDVYGAAPVGEENTVSPLG